MNDDLFRTARTAARRLRVSMLATGFEIQDDTARWCPAAPEDLMAKGDGLWLTIRVAEPSNLAKRYWLVRSVRRWIQTLNLIVRFARRH
jgi:hypothetical protein